jgi:curved DNA-binding protein CbpA
MPKIDLNRTEYDKLGITETFDGDIEALRRNLAKKYHPDTGGNPNAARMKEINNACDTLGDSKKRQAYDDALHHARENTRTEPQERTKGRQHSAPHPPPPRRPPSPPPRPPLRAPSLSVRLWFVPTFIPIVGPAVSWAYAAIAAASPRFARWALLYGALLAFAIVSAISSRSHGGNSSAGSEAIAVALVLWWIFGPMIQVLRRRREVIDAMGARNVPR